MRTVAIVQARMGSTRLPGKVLMELGGRPMLAFMLARLEQATTLDAILVATSTERRDDPITDLCAQLEIPAFRGPEQDVLARYVLAAQASQADVVVRLTADCPLICSDVTDRIVQTFKGARPPADYVSNTLRRTFPRGLDTEAVTRGCLELAARESSLPADREHVTHFVWRQPTRFRLVGVENGKDNSDLRWTVDTVKDLDAVRSAVCALGERATTANYDEILSAYRAHPEWVELNRHVEQGMP